MYRSVVLAVLAAYVLPSAACGQEEKKVFNKTQAEWLTILDEHKEKKFRRAAVFALKEFPRSKEVLAALAKALAKDSEPEVRREIASTLGSFGSDGATLVDVLAQRLEKDDDARVREAAARSLGRLAEYASIHVPRLGNALKDADPDTSSAAAEALVLFGDKAKEVAPQLLTAAADPKTYLFTRIYAVRILAKQAADDKTALVLAGILADRNAPFDLRQTAATGLTSMGPLAGEAVPILAETMVNDKRGDKEDKEQVFELRRLAGVALGKIGPRSITALPAVLKMMSDPDVTLRNQAVRLAGNLGKGNGDISRELLKLLKTEKNAEVLVAVIQESAELGIEAAVAPLTELANDSRATIRDAASLSLKKLKGEKSEKSEK